MHDIKLTVIGGGSSYTPELADGIIRRHAKFPVREIALVDVEEGLEKVRIIEAFLKRMFKRAGLPVKVWSTLDRRLALKDADFIVSQFRAGGLDARSKDEKIPLRFGIIGQETTGPGGFANALRTIPIALEICKDIEELCPDAWLINFTNPSGIISEAINRHSKVRCIGLCNVPINMERGICRTLGIEPGRVHCRFIGLNHLSIVGKLFVDGEDMLRVQCGSRFIRGSIVKNIDGSDIPQEFIDAMGLIPSPYLKYYYLKDAMLRDETEKYMQEGITRADEVRRTEEALFKKYNDENTDEIPEELSQRGGSLYSEAAVSLMASIRNDTGEIHVVNVRNMGSTPDLPYDAVIETNCIVNREGATPLAYGPMPEPFAGLAQHVKSYELLTVEAAVEGSRSKAILALAANPLVGDLNTATAMFDEICKAHCSFLKHFERRAD